jgi:hypothetical protein
MGTWPPEERLLFDARATKWASPYGFVALLTAGQALAELKAETPRLMVPDLEDVRSYWAKAGFFKYAAEYFELVGKCLAARRTRAPTSWCRSAQSATWTTSTRSSKASASGCREC